MGDDHDVPTARRLRDRLPDQRANVVAAQLLPALAGPAARQRPRLAALPQPLEQAHGERLAPLLVRDLRGVDAPCGRRAGNDVVVDVEEAQLLRDEPADLIASGARCVRDAHDPVPHGHSTLGAEAAAVKESSPRGHGATNRTAEAGSDSQARQDHP